MIQVYNYIVQNFYTFFLILGTKTQKSRAASLTKFQKYMSQIGIIMTEL